MYTTFSETRTINIVEYVIKNYDFDISKHNTEYEYEYSTILNDGGTSIDVSDLPSYTPSICHIIYPKYRRAIEWQ